MVAVNGYSCSDVSFRDKLGTYTVKTRALVLLKVQTI